jgi:hypothetical protein
MRTAPRMGLKAGNGAGPDRTGQTRDHAMPASGCRILIDPAARGKKPTCHIDAASAKSIAADITGAGFGLITDPA